MDEFQVLGLVQRKMRLEIIPAGTKNLKYSWYQQISVKETERAKTRAL